MNGRSRILEVKRSFSFINLDPRILLELKILCFRPRFCFKLSRKIQSEFQFKIIKVPI